MLTRGRRKEASHQNHDRWLVSYADFITLLFAFFVLMFASSQTDAAKIKALSRSVNEAFKGRTGNVPVDLRSDLMKSSDALGQTLSSDIAAGRIGIAMEGRGLVISLQESAFFPSGSDALLPAALPSLNKIAGIIGKLPNAIRLEGHTDSIPIRNSRFRNNWELAAARSVAVLESFTQQHGIPPSRLAVVAYAETIPKASNETEVGRAANRRVDVTILNDTAFTREACGTSDGQKNAH